MILKDKILIMKEIVFFICLCLAGVSVQAQQFSYRPINPFFGGDTFNYQQLLSSANAQNSFTAPANAQDQQTDLERFGNQLNTSILNQISRELTQQQLDAIGSITEPGSFSFGSLALDVFESPEGLVINILDTNTGEETQIVVPN